MAKITSTGDPGSLYNAKIISFHNQGMKGCGPQSCMNCEESVRGKDHYFASGTWNTRMRKSNWVLCTKCYPIALLAGDFVATKLGPVNAREYPTEDHKPYQGMGLIKWDDTVWPEV